MRVRCRLNSFIHPFNFRNIFILVGVAVDLEPILGILGVSWEYILNQSMQGSIHTYTHSNLGAINSHQNAFGQCEESRKPQRIPYRHGENTMRTTIVIRVQDRTLEHDAGVASILLSLRNNGVLSMLIILTAKLSLHT